MVDILHLRRRLLIAAGGGLVGFFVLLLARTIVIGVSVMSGLIFGGGSLTAWENLIIFGFVPILISFGAAIPAWALGSNRWSGFLAGVAAMGVIILIRVFGNPIYSPFNSRETLQFVSAISVTVLISEYTKERLSLGNFAVLLTLIIIFLALAFVIPGNEIELASVGAKVGFLLSLFAWLILPSVAAFITQSEQNR